MSNVEGERAMQEHSDYAKLELRLDNLEQDLNVLRATNEANRLRFEQMGLLLNSLLAKLK